MDAIDLLLEELVKRFTADPERIFKLEYQEQLNMVYLFFIHDHVELSDKLSAMLVDKYGATVVLDLADAAFKITIAKIDALDKADGTE